MKKRENILQLQYDDKLMANLSNHFFASHDNVYVFDNSTLLGVITYEDFMSSSDSMQEIIKEVPICKESHDCFNHDLFVVLGKNGVAYEYSKETEDPMSIKSRFSDLYDDNDKIINYLRSLNIKKVVIFGSFKEKLFNHLEMYGNDFEIVCGDSIDDYYTAIDNGSYIIDTDSEITEFKEKLGKSYQLVNGHNDLNLISLEKLCELSEYYYFVNSVTKNPEINVSVLEFPDIHQLENLSDEERFRIAFDHLYRYYYARYKENPYIDSILRKVFGELYSDDFIKSRDYMPKVFLKGGRCFLENSDNPYCGSRDGERITTDQIYDYNFNINFFGPCLIFGALSDDSRTICSYLQRLVNDNDLDYRVHNYGARAIGLLENIRSFDGVNLYQNDQCIFVVHPDEKKILEEMGFHDFIDLKPVFEDKSLRDYFIDEPVHCNHVANERIAEYTFDKMKERLLARDPKNEELAKPISIKKKKNVFGDNAYLKEYLEFLDKIEVTTDNNGCILMNCNPFTYGHYRLIEYASKQVPTLYVFVVQENRSYFDFTERFEMVKEGCKNFPNVVVIPSGKIFASAMLFPEYFNKEDNPDVGIDVSLDRELFTGYIAPTLNITKRFVGEENFDLVTRAYNKELKKNLPLYGIEVFEIPRFREGDKEISAKVVRKALEDEDWETIGKLVPETTVKVLKKRKGE